MRISQIQKRRDLPPEAQPVPVRRALAWLVAGAGIAFGIFLFFKYGRDVTPLLG